jgi:hypothetical protein
VRKLHARTHLLGRRGFRFNDGKRGPGQVAPLLPCPVSVRHGEENRYPGTLPCVVAGSLARAAQLQGPLSLQGWAAGQLCRQRVLACSRGVHPSPQRAAWILSIKSSQVDRRVRVRTYICGLPSTPEQTEATRTAKMNEPWFCRWAESSDPITLGFGVL